MPSHLDNDISVGFGLPHLDTGGRKSGRQNEGETNMTSAELIGASGNGISRLLLVNIAVARH
jgi:hypothetical protein